MMKHRRQNHQPMIERTTQLLNNSRHHKTTPQRHASSTPHTTTTIFQPLHHQRPKRQLLRGETPPLSSFWDEGAVDGFEAKMEISVV